MGTKQPEVGTSPKWEPARSRTQPHVRGTCIQAPNQVLWLNLHTPMPGTVMAKPAEASRDEMPCVWDQSADNWIAIQTREETSWWLRTR